MKFIFIFPFYFIVLLQQNKRKLSRCQSGHNDLKVHFCFGPYIIITYSNAHKLYFLIHITHENVFKGRHVLCLVFIKGALWSFFLFGLNSINLVIRDSGTRKSCNDYYLSSSSTNIILMRELLREMRINPMPQVGVNLATPMLFLDVIASLDLGDECE